MYVVDWYDACAYTQDIKIKKPYKKMLAIQHSSAIEIIKDKDCVILIQERADGFDEPGTITVIPRGWVKKITKYAIATD